MYHNDLHCTDKRNAWKDISRVWHNTFSLSGDWFACLFVIRVNKKKRLHWEVRKLPWWKDFSKEDAHSALPLQTSTRLETFRAVNTNMFFCEGRRCPEGRIKEVRERERHFAAWCLNCHSVSKPFLRWPNANKVVYLRVCITRHRTQHLILLICTSCHHSQLK